MAAVRKKLFAGRFEIEEEAGAGGAGTVYRARDVGTGERVALKVLRTPVNTAAERFSREAQTLAMLRHPAVVRYISHGVTEDGESYLAMEWLEGQDLRRHLGQQGISVAETVALGIRVAGALAAVHALGVLHRDVKPSNLFLVGGRVTDVKLIDFGLVRLDDVGHSLTRSGVAVGTPGYMAPEQARGDRDSDQRADVFSLGCVLFKCLTGRPPFEGSHLVAVLTKVLLEDAPRVRSLRPDLLDALDALIARMLEKDPARRPAGAAEVADALRSIEANGLADSSDPALAPASRQFSGLTDSEQRIAAVLLIAPAADLDEGAARAAELESLVDRFACHLERLTDGTRVITIARPPTALDQAARIARCALAARELLPGVPMALATGWSVTAGQALMGEAIDRAAGLLAQPSVEAARSGIAVDEVTAALLDTQFTLEVTLEGEAGGPGSARLTGLRDTAIVARTLLGKVTPCLGREWELSTIEAQLGECAEECRAVALVFSAPAGMGKSRLAVEAVAALQRSPRPRWGLRLAQRQAPPPNPRPRRASPCGSPAATPRARDRRWASSRRRCAARARSTRVSPSRSSAAGSPSGWRRPRSPATPPASRSSSASSWGCPSPTTRAPPSAPPATTRSSRSSRCAGPSSTSSAPSAWRARCSSCSTICTGPTPPRSASSTPRSPRWSAPR